MTTFVSSDPEHPNVLRAVESGPSSSYRMNAMHNPDTHRLRMDGCVDDAVVHKCPPEGTGIMPCCGLTPFETRAERMTLNDADVTCHR